MRQSSAPFSHFSFKGFHHDPDTGWPLYRDNKPYFINGAGSYNHFEDLAAAG
jgi:hypothetical protein